MDSFRSASVWAIKIGLFIVPFIPLYVSRVLFFPYITGKAFVFRVIVELIFVLWVALAIFYKEFRIQRTPLFYALIAFLAIITLASVLGVNPSRSFWSNFERMEGLLMHLHLFAYFLVAGHVLKRKDWIIFFNFFVVAGFGQDIVTLLQKIGVVASPQGGARTDGTIGNATYVAAYSIFVLAISLLLFLRTKVTWARVWYGFMVLFTLFTIYFTATRGVTLALFVGFLVSGILYLLLQKGDAPRTRKYKKIVVGALAVLVVGAALLQIFKDSSFVKGSDALSRIASISLKEGQTRFRIWNMAFQGFKERPVLGWGLENYNAVFGKYYDPGLYAQEPWFDRSHQIVLDWLINAGLLGLLAYLGIFVAALTVLWKWYKAIPTHDGEKSLWLRTSILISVLFFVYFAQNVFVFDQFATYMSFFSILAFIQTVATERPKERHEVVTPAGARDPLKWAGTAGLLLAVVVLMYFVNWKPLMANKFLLKGLAERSVNSFDHYKKALAYGPLGKTEIREQLAQFTMAVFQSPDADPSFREKVFTLATQELREGEKENPLDPRAALFTGIVYTEAGQFDEAEAAFKRALVLTPRKQQVFFQLGDLYIRKNEYGVAREILEQAFELEPRFAQARMSLVAGYILNNEQARADALLIETYRKTAVPQLVLAQAYARKRDYRRLLAVWQAFLEEDPANIEYWKNVAAVHLELGENAKAITVLEDAIEKFPTFREEGETYIREIRTSK